MIQQWVKMNTTLDGNHKNKYFDSDELYLCIK